MTGQPKTPTRPGSGGARPGSGPKPKPEKRKQVALYLPPNLIRWLRENVENRNAFIVEAIREKIDKESKKWLKFTDGNQK